MTVLKSCYKINGNKAKLYSEDKKNMTSIHFVARCLTGSINLLPQRFEKEEKRVSKVRPKQQREQWVGRLKVSKTETLETSRRSSYLKALWGAKLCLQAARQPPGPFLRDVVGAGRGWVGAIRQATVSPPSQRKGIKGGEGCCNADWQNRNCWPWQSCFAFCLGKTPAFTGMDLPSRVPSNSTNNSPFLIPSFRTESRNV